MKKENNSQQRIYNNKGNSALYRILCFIFPYCIYTKLLPLSLKDSETPKTKTSWWTKLTEKIFKKREPINYNFNMKDFFTLDGKIEENRRFLRETQDKYEKIRNYYPLFFIYIGFIGVYTFDILTYILTTTFTGSVFFLSSLFLAHILLFGYIFWMFSKILVLKDIAVEQLPKIIYGDYEKDVKEKTDNLTPEEINEIEKYNEELKNNELKSYLLGLEEDCEDNFKILGDKKMILSNTVKLTLYSFILYIALISFYKINKMTDPKEPTKIEIVRKPKAILKDHDEKLGKTSIDFTDTSITENPELLRVKEIMYKDKNKKPKW